MVVFMRLEQDQVRLNVVEQGNGSRTIARLDDFEAGRFQGLPTKKPLHVVIIDDEYCWRRAARMLPHHAALSRCSDNMAFATA